MERDSVFITLDVKTITFIKWDNQKDARNKDYRQGNIYNIYMSYIADVLLTFRYTATIYPVSDILFNISLDNTRCQIHFVNPFVHYRFQSSNQPFKEFNHFTLFPVTNTIFLNFYFYYNYIRTSQYASDDICFVRLSRSLSSYVPQSIQDHYY